MVQRLGFLTTRRASHLKVSLIKVLSLTFIVTSFTLNIYFITCACIHEPDAWISKTTHEGMLRVMEYVELEREVDDVIKGEFVKQIWQCMKVSLISAIPNDRVTSHVAMTNTSTNTKKQANKRERFLSSKPIVNDINYSYVYNKVDVCLKEQFDIIFASPSAPTNFERRMKMRAGEFGTFARNPQNKAKLLFFLGRPTYSEGMEPTSVIQEKINAEQAKYQDIVQATFLDTYKDIVLKGLMIPKWCHDFCPNSKFVIRVDDDVSANITGMISALEETQRKHTDFVLGLLRISERPARKKSSKYFSSFEEYPYKDFSPYVLGGCMGYPVKTGGILYEACRRVEPVYWIDDVWISSMCARRIGLPVLDSDPFHFKHGDEWAS